MANFKHFKVYQSVGIEDWVPMCHWALHLPEQLQKHDCLLTCFVKERKHKEVKRTANELDNTFAGFERKILLDTVHAHVVALKGELNVPVNRGHAWLSHSWHHQSLHVLCRRLQHVMKRSPAQTQ